MPLLLHIKLSTEVGQLLAAKSKANSQVVQAGTYLMDCMIGEALRQNRLKNHIEMSANKSSELILNSNISKKDAENIKRCVLEHHGVKKFYSIESEICCNADCYKFVSIKGFSYAMRFLRDMPFKELIELLKNKVEEKWQTLTLDVCKREIEPQYKIIKNYLSYLSK